MFQLLLQNDHLLNSRISFSFLLNKLSPFLRMPFWIENKFASGQTVTYIDNYRKDCATVDQDMLNTLFQRKLRKFKLLRFNLRWEYLWNNHQTLILPKPAWISVALAARWRSVCVSVCGCVCPYQSVKHCPICAVTLLWTSLSRNCQKVANITNLQPVTFWKM